MMGNYEQLKAAVASIVRDNGAEEITGNVLQSVLISIINAVGSGAVFAGIATPSTSPSNPDPNVFYIAVEAGTYPNFNLTVTTGMCIFSNESGTWVGHELGVSSQFESGEYITEVSITDSLEGAETDNLPTVEAINEAVTALNTAIATERQDRQEADGNQTVALNLEKTLRQQGDEANAASVGYYVCDTSAATAAKVVNASGYVLRIGGNIRIEMTNANTAANATLNINGTGAKALFYNGEQASSSNSWEDGEVLEVYYDGTQYQTTQQAASDTYIEEDVAVLSDLTLINYNANSTSSKTDNGIEIQSITYGGRSGFTFGTLPEGEYHLTFDLSTTSTAATFTLNFARGTNNATTTMTISNNSHVDVVFNAVSPIDSAYLSTSQIGVGKTASLSNIRIYRIVTIQDYIDNVSTAIQSLDERLDAVEQDVVQIVGNEETFDGQIANAFINTSHTYTSHFYFATYEIPNEGYERVHLSVGNKDAGAYAVAFYSTESVSAEGFISGEPFIVGQNEYDVAIPDGCILICVSSRIYDSSYNYTLSYTLTAKYNTAKIDIDGLSGRVNELENMAKSGDNSAVVVNVPYDGNEVSFVRRYRQQGYMFSQLTSVGEVGYGQGFAYSDGYMFFASDGGTLRIWKYSEADPNLTFVKQYALKSSATNNHCNSLNFGQRYDESDKFPLLYISECYGGQRCFVERITLESSTALVQTVTLSTVSSHFGIFVNWIPDLRRNRLLAVGVRPNTRYQFCALEFELPSVSQQDVTLNDSDILKSYDINSGELFQGCAIYKEFLILPIGQYANSQHVIFYNLDNNTTINSVPVSSDVGEPEDAYVVNKDVILFAANGVYKLQFDNTQLPYDLDARIAALEEQVAGLVGG